jgi:hypothetical protein
MPESKDIAADEQSFAEAVKGVAEVKNLCGHDGGLFARDINLGAVVDNKSYLWWLNGVKAL